MTPLAKAIEPKSDQINADDLVSGDIVITITRVEIKEGQDQPISISFEGSPKFFRPSKTTARAMSSLWGGDESLWIGRSLRLYRDPDVTWGGVKIGGIRIREMSHLPGDKAATLAITEKRGQRKLVTIRPLDDGAPPEVVAARQGTEAFRKWWNSDEGKAARAKGAKVTDELKAICAEADAAAKAQEPRATMADRLLAAQKPAETPHDAETGEVAGPEYDPDAIFPGDPVFNEGRDAFAVGDAQSSNPYPSNPEFSNWLAGYRGAAKAKE